MYILSDNLPIGQWIKNKGNIRGTLVEFINDDLLLSYSIIAPKLPIILRRQIKMDLYDLIIDSENFFDELLEKNTEETDEKYYGYFFNSILEIINNIFSTFNGKFRLTEISLHDRMHTIVFSPDEILAEDENNNSELIEMG